MPQGEMLTRCPEKSTSNFIEFILSSANERMSLRKNQRLPRKVWCGAFGKSL